MRMHYVFNFTESLPMETAVTIGKFDGFHLGHRSLLAAVFNEKKKGYASCVVSFSAKTEEERTAIYTTEEKRSLCESLGVDVLAEYCLDETLREMSPEDFISEVLCKRLHAKVIVTGEDFRFGKQRLGDTSLLKCLEKTYGYRTICIPKVTEQEARVSSTQIRELLLQGKMKEANFLLGQPYRMIGEVVHGKKLGRTIGFPTMNLIPSKEKILPAYGVYVTKTCIDGTWYEGITNIGLRPTVDSNDCVSAETYLFQYEGSLYGKQVQLQFLHFLRRERKFPDVESLKAAMHEDFVNAKGILEKYDRIG